MDDELKIKTAVALEYDENDTAPRVVAGGRGYVAEKIVETGKRNDIPVHKDEVLAETLSGLELGSVIPESLYEVVAEVFVLVNKADEKIRGAI